ncbi:hypothetical protein SAMN05444162_1237 [Paenibacillaceae bacterium GAS479]|nr:hypothetical protein SAMN05444162_1237 [Paenibacillaceae bacterium GAS479]
MEETLKELIGVIKGMNTRLESIDERLGLIDGRFDSLESRFETLEGRFDSLESRFETVEGRFDSLESRFETLEGRFDSLESRFETLEGRFDSLEGRQAEGFRQTNERLDRIEKRLDLTFKQAAATAEDITTLNSFTERLDAQRNLIAQIEESVEILKVKVQF